MNMLNIKKTLGTAVFALSSIAATAIIPATSVIGTSVAMTGLMTISSPAQAAIVNGRNANVVSVNNGTFRQVSRKSWVEQNKQGRRVFSFKETHRDAWSVYLYDASRNVRLQLDMHRKMVGYSDGNNPTMRDLYRIKSSSSKLSGWLVKKVKFNKGSFVYRGGKRWVEKGTRNQVRFKFSEVARDDWSVYLKDSSRNVNIQLDLHTKKIMYSVGNDPRVPLYNIKRAR